MDLFKIIVIASTSSDSQNIHKRKHATNVIAKERSDCGNLYSHNAKNVYFLRSAAVELVLDVSSLDLEFTLSVCLLACLPGGRNALILFFF